MYNKGIDCILIGTANTIMPGYCDLVMQWGFADISTQSWSQGCLYLQTNLQCFIMTKPYALQAIAWSLLSNWGSTFPLKLILG